MMRIQDDDCDGRSLQSLNRRIVGLFKVTYQLRICVCSLWCFIISRDKNDHFL